MRNSKLRLHAVYASMRKITMAKTATPVHHLRRSILNRREPLVLANAQGTIVSVDCGSVWITQERDPRDIVLLRGMRFEIDRPGRTIVAAETPSRLRLLVPERFAERVIATVKRALPRIFGRWRERSARRVAPYY
jgi:Protein of unknown function (DUF2917)